MKNGYLYGRMEIKTTKTFNELKKSIIKWIRQELNWINKEYIQAKIISNIGFILGSTSTVYRNLNRTKI